MWEYVNDDTLMTVATMDVLNQYDDYKDINPEYIIQVYREYFDKYAVKYKIGFGHMFLKWLKDKDDVPQTIRNFVWNKVESFHDVIIEFSNKVLNKVLNK